MYPFWQLDAPTRIPPHGWWVLLPPGWGRGVGVGRTTVLNDFVIFLGVNIGGQTCYHVRNLFM
jgi:hypothetical protein